RAIWPEMGFVPSSASGMPSLAGKSMNADWSTSPTTPTWLMMRPQPSPASVPLVTLRCGLSFVVPHPSRRRKKRVVPAEVSANVAPPAIARYGVRCNETFEPLAGDVIVTDVDAEAMPDTTAVAATASASTRALTGFPPLEDDERAGICPNRAFLSENS